MIQKPPPIVGVMGSGRNDGLPLAAELGRFLAGYRIHLLTGGGAGTMASVSRAFYETPARCGLVVGILPCVSEDAPTVSKPGYPNPWVELAVKTHLPYSGERGCDPLSRNHINILTADMIVALPGGAGTASELSLAKRYKRPLIALDPEPKLIYHELGLTRFATVHDLKPVFERLLQDQG